MKLVRLADTYIESLKRCMNLVWTQRLCQENEMSGTGSLWHLCIGMNHRRSNAGLDALNTEPSAVAPDGRVKLSIQRLQSC